MIVLNTTDEPITFKLLTPAPAPRAAAVTVLAHGIVSLLF
jgi:hypothetical protein